MTIWSQYPKSCQKEYEEFVRMFGSLSAMFNQKSSKTGAPYLDSKFQETIYAKSFNKRGNGRRLLSKDVDIGNTPHDILSVFPDGSRIGIGIKTWLSSKRSYQKVMQLKSYRNIINKYLIKAERETAPLRQDTKYELAQRISDIKNRKLKVDYTRLGLTPNRNIYSYITRDKGLMKIQETSYPEVNVNNIQEISFKHGRKNRKTGKRGISSIEFNDGKKYYRYTFSDSQVYMLFNRNKNDHFTVKELPIHIKKYPFEFLKNAFEISEQQNNSGPIITPSYQGRPVYLPMYSYRYKHKVINDKSGLNASLGAPKKKGSDKKRPEYEAYIPVPKQFRILNAHWFSPNVDLTNHRKFKQEYRVGSFKFTLHLPNGKTCPALVGQDNFKGLESDPQDVLGKWILKDIFHKKPYEKLTMTDLNLIGLDSLKLWHKIPNDYHDVWIDFATLNSYKKFIRQEKNHEYL